MPIVNLPREVKSCRECPYLQLQGIRSEHGIKTWSWFCALLQREGVAYFITYHGADDPGTADWTIPESCPLRRV